MNIEITPPAQLKVTLSGAELAESGLSYNDLDYKNEDSKRFLWSLIQRARGNGFDRSAFSKMIIEVFPAPDGGCVIYFTCTAEAGRSGAKLRLHRTESRTEIFSFADSDDLIDAVRAVGSMYPEKAARLSSTLYLTDGGYRLLVSGRGGIGEISLVLGEYGKRCGSDSAAAAYLSEHGKILADGNAFARVGGFA